MIFLYIGNVLTFPIIEPYKTIGENKKDIVTTTTKRTREKAILGTCLDQITPKKKKKHRSNSNIAIPTLIIPSGYNTPFS